MNYNGNQTFDKYGILVPNMLGEEWAAWPKDEDISQYQVSTAGRIRRIVGKGWQLINPIYLGDTTIAVRLNVDGHQKTLALKKLIAEVWVNNPVKSPDVLVINKQYDDLRSSNLVWYDFKETRRAKTNLKDRIRAKVKLLSIENLTKIYEIMDNM